MLELYLTSWKKYGIADGRATRREFWAFTIGTIFLYVIIWFLDKALAGITVGLYEEGPILLFFFLATIIPSLAVTVRRLHDIGKSGWWYFINAIPLIGPLCFLMMMIYPATPGANKYGPNPRIQENPFIQ